LVLASFLDFVVWVRPWRVQLPAGLFGSIGPKGVVISADTVTVHALLKGILAADPVPGPVTLATVILFDVPEPA